MPIDPSNPKWQEFIKGLQDAGIASAPPPIPKDGVNDGSELAKAAALRQMGAVKSSPAAAPVAPSVDYGSTPLTPDEIRNRQYLKDKYGGPSGT